MCTTNSCENTVCSCENITNVTVSKVNPAIGNGVSTNSFSMETVVKKNKFTALQEEVRYIYNSTALGSTSIELVNNIHVEIISNIVDIIRTAIDVSNYPNDPLVFVNSVHLLTKDSFVSYFINADGVNIITDNNYIGKITYIAESLYGLMKRIEAHILTNNTLFGLDFSCDENETSRALKSCTSNCIFDLDFIFN